MRILAGYVGIWAGLIGVGVLAFVWPPFLENVAKVFPLVAFIWCGWLSDRLQKAEREIKSLQLHNERLEDAVREIA